MSSDSEEYDSSDDELELPPGEILAPQAGYESSDEEELRSDVALVSSDPAQAGSPGVSDTEPDLADPDRILEEPGLPPEQGFPGEEGGDLEGAAMVASPRDSEERDDQTATIDAESDPADDDRLLDEDTTAAGDQGSNFQEGGGEREASYTDPLTSDVQEGEQDDPSPHGGAGMSEEEAASLLGEEGEGGGGGGSEGTPEETPAQQSEGDKEMAEAVAAVTKKARKFLEDSDSEGEAEEEEGRKEEAPVQQAPFSMDMEDVFGEESDDDAPVVLKRKRKVEGGGVEGESGEEEEEASPVMKKVRAESDGSSEGGEGGEGEEVAELEREEGVEEGGGGRAVGGEEDSDDEPEEEPKDLGPSDWDVMMQRRKDAMARARKRKQKNSDFTGHDDHIMAMIREMRAATEEDRQLNLARKAATKKLQMLPTVLTHLKKSDLQSAFIENGILTMLAEWLTPLPDHSLPHAKIRESLLDLLRTYPLVDSSLLKESKVGKAVMLLYRHPKESRKNKEKAGKLINEWARPIFGLASDFKSLSRDEREKRDYAHLSQAARRRMSSGERSGAMEDEEGPQKPGDKGWIGRARVPLPSNRDYVVRPKWNIEQEYKKATSKKVLNRYEKQLQKKKVQQQLNKTTHAIGISVEGRKMPL